MNEPKIEIFGSENFNAGIIKPEDVNPLSLKRPTFKELHNVDVEEGFLVRSSGYEELGIALPVDITDNGYSITKNGFIPFNITQPVEKQCYLIVATKPNERFKLFIYPTLNSDGSWSNEWEELNWSKTGTIFSCNYDYEKIVVDFGEPLQSLADNRFFGYNLRNSKTTLDTLFNAQVVKLSERIFPPLQPSDYNSVVFSLFALGNPANQPENKWYTDDTVYLAKNYAVIDLNNTIGSKEIQLTKSSFICHSNILRLFIRYIDAGVEKNFNIVISPITDRTFTYDTDQEMVFNMWGVGNYDIKDITKSPLTTITEDTSEGFNAMGFPSNQGYNNVYKFTQGIILNGYQYAGIIPINPANNIDQIIADTYMFVGTSGRVDHRDKISIKVQFPLGWFDFRISHIFLACQYVSPLDYFGGSSIDLGDYQQSADYNGAAGTFAQAPTNAEDFIVYKKIDLNNISIDTTGCLVAEYDWCPGDDTDIQNWLWVVYGQGGRTVEKPPKIDNLGTVGGLLNRFGNINDVFNLDCNPIAKVIKLFNGRLYFANMPDYPNYLRFSTHSGNGVSMLDIAPMSESGGLGYFLVSSEEVDTIKSVASCLNNQLLVFQGNSVLVYELAGGKALNIRLREIFKGFDLSSVDSIETEGQVGTIWLGEKGDLFLYDGGSKLPVSLTYQRIKNWLYNNYGQYLATSFGCWDFTKNIYILYLQTDTDVYVAIKFKLSQSSLTITTQSFSDNFLSLIRDINRDILFVSPNSVFKKNYAIFTQGINDIPAEGAYHRSPESLIESNIWNHGNYFSNYNGISIFAERNTNSNINIDAITNDETTYRNRNHKLFVATDLFSEENFGYNTIYSWLKLRITIPVGDTIETIRSFGWKYTERLVNYYKGLRRSSNINKHV